MKNLKLITNIIAALSAGVLLSFSATAYDNPYFIKDGDIKGFTSWEETLDYINRHGNSETDYVIYIDEDATVANSMTFPSSSKAKSITFKGVSNNRSGSFNDYSNSDRDETDEVHTITLKGIKSLQAQCDIIFENIVFSSDTPFTFKVKNDITFDTNFVAENMVQLTGSSNSTLWINIPEGHSTTDLNYIGEGGFSTNNFDGQTKSGKYYITKYTGSSADIGVPADANGADTVSVAVDAFADVKSTMKSIAFESGSKYTIQSGTFEAYPLLKEVRIGYYLDIAGGAFKDCPALESVIFTNSGNTPRDIREGAFENCTSLKTLKVPGENINIEANAFKNCPIEALTIPGSAGEAFADTDGLALVTLTLTGDAVDAEHLAELIQEHSGTLKTVNLTSAALEAFEDSGLCDDAWKNSGLFVCVDPPVIIPTLDCKYKISGFSEIRPAAGIRINAHEEFKVDSLVLDNEDIFSVYDNKVTLKYLISANKSDVRLIFNDEFTPINISGEALCTNNVILERNINGAKALFDWDCIVFNGKNIVPEDMFCVDPECLENNGTIPYLLSKEKNDVYIRRLAFRLSGKNGNDSEITPVYFSQWKDLIEYIETETSGADILISVLTDTDIGQALKMPKRGKFSSLTIAGGDFERVKTGSGNYLTYKGHVLPLLSSITLPDGKSLSMTDFSDSEFDDYHDELSPIMYKISRRKLTFSGGINLTGDTNIVNLTLNSCSKSKGYNQPFNINAGKYTLMLDQIYSDGGIKNVNSSGDLYLAGGPGGKRMHFTGIVRAKNIYIMNGFIRIGKSLSASSSTRTYNSGLAEIISEKADIDTSIDKANTVDLYIDGTISTKLFESSSARIPSTDTVDVTSSYATIYLNISKTSIISTFSRKSLPIYFNIIDNFENYVIPYEGQKIFSIKGDYLRGQLKFFTSNLSDFEVARSANKLVMIKKGYGYYALDNSTVSENPVYNKYRYAYASLNDAVTDINRMKTSAEYVIALPRYVRQINKLTKLKASSHNGPVKLVVDPDTMDNAVQDKDYIIGVNKSAMKALGVNDAFDWTSEVEIDVDTGNTITPFQNPIKIYSE